MAKAPQPTVLGEARNADGPQAAPQVEGRVFCVERDECLFTFTQGSILTLLPYASLASDGYFNGNYHERETSGLADPVFYFSINTFGAPVLSATEFKSYQQDTIVGLTFKVTAPLGDYDPDKVINPGSNRWSFKPEVSVSKALGNWTLEVSVSAVFYTDNNDFINGKTRQQKSIYASQFHVIYLFPRNIWAALGATYYTGGQTTIDGVSRNDLQETWRTGFTLALPINRQHSIKLFGGGGVSTRTGNNYDVFGIAWQYRWGEGI
jgi:hypothetical protein